MFKDFEAHSVRLLFYFILVPSSLHLISLSSYQSYQIAKFGPTLDSMAITKILVLGSGMVARPCVEYLVRDPKNEVTIGKTSRVYSVLALEAYRIVRE